MAPPKLKFSDYDALGFDLDHTVSKYNLPEMYEVSSYSVTFHKKMIMGCRSHAASQTYHHHDHDINCIVYNYCLVVLFPFKVRGWL